VKIAFTTTGKGWDAQEFLNHRKYWYAEISQIMSGEKFNFYTNEITQKDIKKAEDYYIKQKELSKEKRVPKTRPSHTLIEYTGK